MLSKMCPFSVLFVFNIVEAFYSIFVTLDLSIHEKKSTSDQSEMWPRYKKSAKCELTVCRCCQLHTKSKWNEILSATH